MSGHAALSAYGRLTSDPRIMETRTGTAMPVGRLAVARPRREHAEDGEAKEELSILADGLVSARTIRPGGGHKRKPAASSPDPLLVAEPERTEPVPVPEGPITDDDIPF